jgi:hypothetical protein
LIEALSNEIVLKILQQRFNARFLAGHTKRYFLMSFGSYRKILVLSIKCMYDIWGSYEKIQSNCPCFNTLFLGDTKS